MRGWAERYFEIRSRQSTLTTEVLAGVSTFLALSYIFIVNPAILEEAGIDRRAVLFATIVTSGLATLVMGLWARLPFVLAPGMEMNAYVAYFAVGSLGLTWQQALGAVFWSGIVFIVLTVSRSRKRIIEAIPDRMKTGLSLSVGVFLCLVALKIAGILHYNELRLTGFGTFSSTSAMALYGGLAVALALDRLRVPGPVLWSILGTTLLCHLLEAPVKQPVAKGAEGQPWSAVGELDLGVILRPTAWNVILVLFLIDFYGSVAKFIGLVRKTNLIQAGELPGLDRALLVDGAAIPAGAALGTSSVLVYVESGVGIASGGRTGLTAVVCALMMLSCFAVAPLLHHVPIIATTGCLVFVGFKLCPSLSELGDYRFVDLLVLLVMQITVIATFALDRAMLTGFLFYVGSDLVARRKPNPYAMVSLILLSVGFVVQIMG